MKDYNVINVINVINYLKKKNKKEYKLNEDLDKSDNCSICLENYNKDNIINVLKCGHKYHKDCIDDWINDNNNCPLCRLSL